MCCQTPNITVIHFYLFLYGSLNELYRTVRTLKMHFINSRCYGGWDLALGNGRQEKQFRAQ